MILRILGRCKEYYTRVLDLPDAPVKVAWGAALGTALDFYPIPIISIPVAYLLARLIGSNGVAAALAAAFFKWAVPFFYLFNVAVGQLITGDWSMTVAVFNGSAGVEWTDALSALSVPFFVGALFNSLLAGGIVYFCLKRLLEFRRRRRNLVTSCQTGVHSAAQHRERENNSNKGVQHPERT